MSVDTQIAIAMALIPFLVVWGLLALTSRLAAARKAIGDSGQAQRYIRTVHGRGYRFVGQVEAREELAAT